MFIIPIPAPATPQAAAITAMVREAADRHEQLHGKRPGWLYGSDKLFEVVFGVNPVADLPNVLNVAWVEGLVIVANSKLPGVSITSVAGGRGEQ